MAEHTRRVKQDYKDYWGYILFSGKPLRNATRPDILESVEKRRAQVRGHEVHIAKELSIAEQLPNDTITVGEWLARRERDGRSPPPPEPRPTA
jgi:hypothetical protein